MSSPTRREYLMDRVRFLDTKPDDERRPLATQRDVEPSLRSDACDEDNLVCLCRGQSSLLHLVRGTSDHVASQRRRIYLAGRRDIDVTAQAENNWHLFVAWGREAGNSKRGKRCKLASDLSHTRRHFVDFGTLLPCRIRRALSSAMHFAISPRAAPSPGNCSHRRGCRSIETCQCSVKFCIRCQALSQRRACHS
jgi:hypothetical protein